MGKREVGRGGRRGGRWSSSNKVGRYTVRAGRGSTLLRCVSCRSFPSYFICSAGGSRLGACRALLSAAVIGVPVQLIC